MDGPVCAGPVLPGPDFARLRRELVLRGCKWDPQVEDAGTICPFPLIMRRSEWLRLAAWAEALTSEATAAEDVLLASDSALRRLGLAPNLRRALLARRPPPVAARVLRYDFHWTRDGWRLSEANSDVPGGYTEASVLPRLMSVHHPGTSTAGEPLQAWAAAVARAAGGQPVALLSAPGFMEDHQVVAALQRTLDDLGLASHHVQPRQLAWERGAAHLPGPGATGRLGAVARFFQAEWLDPSKEACRPLFEGGLTPVTNPPSAIAIESKRFPLLWDELGLRVPTWRALMPEARDPRESPWRADDGWMLKGALSNNGDAVLAVGESTPRAWSAAVWGARLRPRAWVAQRRFESVPVETPVGPRHLCLGVYTVDGRAVGLYGRLSERPIVDYRAADVAVLLDAAEVA